jgi:hypothetical protein
MIQAIINEQRKILMMKYSVLLLSSLFVSSSYACNTAALQSAEQTIDRALLAAEKSDISCLAQLFAFKEFAEQTVNSNSQLAAIFSLLPEDQQQKQIENIASQIGTNLTAKLHDSHLLDELSISQDTCSYKKVKNTTPTEQLFSLSCGKEAAQKVLVLNTKNGWKILPALPE